MRRLFYKGILKDAVKITGEDAHHLKNVGRAKIGDEILIVDDENSAARMKISAFDENGIVFSMLERVPLIGKSKTSVTAAMAVLKGEKTDFVIQKLTELGITQIIPLITSRVIVKLDEKKRMQRVTRWEKIAREAAIQSGGFPPKIFPITNLEEFLKRAPKNLLFFYENEEDMPIKTALLGMEENISFLIGPEGGFSQSEAEQIINAGAKSATLGKRILRAETAALVAATLIMYEKGEMS